MNLVGLHGILSVAWKLLRNIVLVTRVARDRCWQRLVCPGPRAFRKLSRDSDAELARDRRRRRSHQRPARLARGRRFGGCVGRLTRPRLLLAAEMTIPDGSGWTFDVQPDADGSQSRQTTIFDPTGCEASRTGTCSTRCTTGSSPRWCPAPTGQWSRPQVLRHSSTPWRRCAASSETRCGRATPSLTNDFVVGAGPCAASTSEHSRCTHDLRTEPLGSPVLTPARRRFGPPTSVRSPRSGVDTSPRQAPRGPGPLHTR
jgi:hypothetical protein